jgi:hypothetical protein
MSGETHGLDLGLTTYGDLDFARILEPEPDFRTHVIRRNPS